MGAEERFRRMRQERERTQFDANVAMALRRGDERAFPADKFGSAVRPGTLVWFFPMEPTPPVHTVTEVAQVLDPRAPAGALRIRMVTDIIVPAGAANPCLLVIGDAPQEEPSSDPASGATGEDGPSGAIERPAEAPREAEVSRIHLTDAH